MYSYDDLKAVVRELSNRLGLKLYVLEEKYNCILITAATNNDTVLVAVFGGQHSLYAKVVKAAEVPLHYQSCEYVEYVPYGLYAFGRDSSTLVQSIVNKVQKLING